MTRKRRKPRYWNILNYELQMYYGITVLQNLELKLARAGDLTKIFRGAHISDNLATQILGVIQAVITSGQTETKALHVRVLTEMFLSRKIDTDLNIDDLIPTWRGMHPDLIAGLRKAYTEKLKTGNSPKGYIDTYMAHPTRMRGDHFDWRPVIKIMDPPIKEILATLPTKPLPMLSFFRDTLKQ